MGTRLPYFVFFGTNMCPWNIIFIFLQANNFHDFNFQSPIVLIFYLFIINGKNVHFTAEKIHDLGLPNVFLDIE